MDQVAMTLPRIYAALEDLQEDHQLVVIDVACKIAKQFVFVLTDPVSTHSYIPRVVEICALRS